jgi:hypothetical protein
MYGQFSPVVRAGLAGKSRLRLSFGLPLGVESDSGGKKRLAIKPKYLRRNKKRLNPFVVCRTLFKRGSFIKLNARVNIIDGGSVNRFASTIGGHGEFRFLCLKIGRINPVYLVLPRLSSIAWRPLGRTQSRNAFQVYRCFLK